jgi:hypothetical protein
VFVDFQHLFAVKMLSLNSTALMTQVRDRALCNNTTQSHRSSSGAYCVRRSPRCVCWTATRVMQCQMHRTSITSRMKVPCARACVALIRSNVLCRWCTAVAGAANQSQLAAVSQHVRAHASGAIVGVIVVVVCTYTLERLVLQTPPAADGWTTSATPDAISISSGQTCAFNWSISAPHGVCAC